MRCCWECKMITTLENGLAISCKVKPTLIIPPSHFIPECPKEMKIRPHRNMYVNVHGSKPQIGSYTGDHEQMDRWTKWDASTQQPTARQWKRMNNRQAQRRGCLSQNYSTWKKPSTRVHILLLHLHETLEEANLMDTESNHISSCLRAGMGQGVAFYSYGKVIYFYCDYTSV